MPTVALDNRDRYGSRPSCSAITRPVVAETNSIDENEAEAKLEDNIAVQNAATLPTATA